MSQSTASMTSVINLDIKGEQTGRQYEGAFEVRLFLTNKHRTEVTRNFNKMTANFEKRSSFDMQSFGQFLMEKKIEDGLAGDILAFANQCLGYEDPMLDMYQAMALVGVHVTSAPDWWLGESKIGGFDLMDFSPVGELYKHIIQLQADYHKSNEK